MQMPIFNIPAGEEIYFNEIGKTVKKLKGYK